MESTVVLNESVYTPGDEVYSSDLIAALDYYANKIKVLSLDCFDTLLWRKTAHPADVFYDLQQKPAFQAIKLNAFLRIHLESQARSLKLIQAKSTEVTLHDIYQKGYPALSPAELDQLAEEELAAEMETCYAFSPVINLIRAAHDRGLKIIIVSNTYFNKNQLQRLLAHCLPTDVMAAINTIYCSSEYGVSKINGLFKHVLHECGHQAESILHIGDNASADLKAPREHGLYSLQLMQHNHEIIEFLRLHAASASIFNPAVRNTQPLISPFRGILANAKINTPEQMVGYVSIGPLMYAFAEFILDEVEQLKKSGKNPKVLFLMRDAYLPSLVCETLNGKPIGKKIRISRFASYAATFRCKEDIEKYLSEVILSFRFRDMARQLLLPDEIIEPLTEVTLSSDSPVKEFIDQIQRDDIQNIIIKKSADYRERLIKYLKKEINLKRGDTLIFVDLGYSGTVQRQLEPLLKEKFDVEIIGRYLIELNIPGWDKSRRGLLDPSWCDDRAMLAIVNYVALLEQICTSNEKSVIDYDDHGNPVFSKTSFLKNQYDKLEKIQHECIRFIKDAKTFFSETGKLPIKILRETALAELARLIFLPTESEIKYLESFQFDLNLGTHDVLRVFDSNAGLNSLRKRGLFFSAMEKNQKTMRTNYPAELRSAGLELVMTLMTQSRFAVELGFKDMSLRREKIYVVIAEKNKTTQSEIEALLTYDGYYSITLPVSNKQFHVNILFGKNYHWLEIDNAEIIKMDAFLNTKESMHAENYWENISFHDMSNKGGKLYECLSTSSSVNILPLPNNIDNENYIVRIIFRPIVSRSA